MIILDKMIELLDLEEKYMETFGLNDGFPIEYYHIDNLDIKKALLEESLRTNTRLEDLDIVKRMHNSMMNDILQENIEISASKKK